MKIKANNSKGYYDFDVGGVLDIAYPGSKFRRGRVQGNGQIAPAITVVQTIVRIEDDSTCDNNKKKRE